MKQSHGRVVKWSMALALVLGLALVRGPLLADDGPGTEFLACRSTAHANYNTCLVNAWGWWGRYACDIAWGIDLFACDLELVGDLVKAIA
jgi:hypothetical protein